MKIVIQAMWPKNPYRREQVNDRSPSKTWLGALTEAQKSYLCQPVLSSVDDSSHIICNVPLCA